MKLVSFDATREITRFDPRGATIAGVARAKGDVHVALLELVAGGVVGMHPASSSQLLLVVAGSGWVRSGDGERRRIERGEAAVWEDGELHETSTEEGLTAVVVEAESLQLIC